MSVYRRPEWNLSNVDNTSDLNKPVSTATLSWLNSYYARINDTVATYLISLSAAWWVYAGSAVAGGLKPSVSVGKAAIGASYGGQGSMDLWTLKTSDNNEGFTFYKNVSNVVAQLLKIDSYGTIWPTGKYLDKSLQLGAGTSYTFTTNFSAIPGFITITGSTLTSITVPFPTTDWLFQTTFTLQIRNYTLNGVVFTSPSTNIMIGNGLFANTWTISPNTCVTIVYTNQAWQIWSQV